MAVFGVEVHEQVEQGGWGTTVLRDGIPVLADGGEEVCRWDEFGGFLLADVGTQGFADLVAFGDPGGFNDHGDEIPALVVGDLFLEDFGLGLVFEFDLLLNVEFGVTDEYVFDTHRDFEGWRDFDQVGREVLALDGHELDEEFEFATVGDIHADGIGVVQGVVPVGPVQGIFVAGFEGVNVGEFVDGWLVFELGPFDSTASCVRE